MKPKILIADDNKGIQLLLSEELSDEGYDVITCGDATLLADAVEQHGPDLIVMDVRPGSLDSLDILKGIRSRYESLPVIFSTVYPAGKNDMKSATGDYFVTKSADLRELKATVKKALSGILDFPGERVGGEMRDM